MSQVNYKSTRLLVEAINRAMEGARKAAMGNMALGELNELRDLIAQLVKRAERIALDDLPIIPIYHYVSKRLVKPWVAGWVDNIVDVHPSRYLSVTPH